MLAARRAFDEGPWPRMGFAERGAPLHRFADLIEANADALALADTTDMGKPVSDARGRTVLINWAAGRGQLPLLRRPRPAVHRRGIANGQRPSRLHPVRAGTRYGLNAMVFTRDLSRAHRASAALRAGTVWVNCFFVRDLRAPFGGVGDSGIGREGGTFSREFFTEPKAVVMAI